jgi:CheY-like chemotaxis protein
LLVEDDWINQEMALELLREVIGFNVQLAEDGQLAVDQAKHNAYDLILMDMQMPEMDGLEATRQIRQHALNAATPILAMTANAFEENRQACFAAGMNDFITKPVDPDLLFITLVKWLRVSGRRAGQEK